MELQQNIFNCFQHKFGPDTVSQLYGLRIAYKAMKYLYLDENYVPMKNSSSSNAQKVIYIDQFFFLTYARVRKHVFLLE